MTFHKKNRKIKILFCIEYLAHGGTEKQLMALIGGINKDKFEPSLCCLRKSIIGENRISEANKLFQTIDCKKIQLDFISFGRIKFLYDLARLIKFIRVNNIQIIQTYFQDPSIMGIIAGKITGIRNIVACFRDMAFWREYEKYKHMKLFYRLCTGFIANSKAVKEEYIELYDLSKKRFNVAVIYNGIDVCKFKKLSDSKKNNKTKNIVVGILANLNRKVKRVDLFINAAAFIHKQKIGIKFVVVGDGELKQRLITQSDELGLSGAIDFPGRVDNIPLCLSCFNIGVISSDSEGFSNTILEYMASGVPVVATKVGGNKEIIQHDVNGLLVPPDNHKAIAEAVIQLAMDEEKYQRLKKNGFMTVSQNYSLGQNIDAYENYYTKLLSSVT